jgi:hypothetical protein
MALQAGTFLWIMQRENPACPEMGIICLVMCQEKIEERIRNIRYQLSKPVSKYNRQKLEERLSILTGSAAVIKVGAPTEMEMKEKKNRIAVSVAGMFLGTETVISIAK